MQNFWDERYSNTEFIYGVEPNAFFKESIKKLPNGKILLPAEGEGRNAIYAAGLGWDVTAFDSSKIAKLKAEKFAGQRNVKINYLLADLTNFYSENNSFDCIGLIYVHTAEEARKNTHQKLLNSLKPGGTVILEGFSKKQIYNTSGGPGNIQMLFTKKDLLDDFSILSQLKVDEIEVELTEGTFHKGIASVVRLIGQK